MKKYLFIGLTAAAAALLSGCSTTGNADQKDGKPAVSEIAPVQLNAVIAQGRTMGETLLKAYKNYDYKLAEKLNIGDDKVKFTADRFERVTKMLKQQGGIAQYSYMGELNMKPARRLFWKVSFNGSKKYPAAADNDMLFELRIVMYKGQCRAAGFGFLPL